MTKEELNKIISIISTHSDDEGRDRGAYCDTGEDMDWGCRSECMQLAIRRLKKFYDYL